MKIGVFCSAKLDFPENTIAACREFAAWMGEEKHTLVYGGARVGLMGLVADEILKRGGQVEGYMPRGLFPAEIPHRQIQKLVEVKDLFERKGMMMESSEAFVILPGGIGTLDEFFEVLTWRTLNCFDKPILVYNIDGFWNSLSILMNDLRLKNVLHAGTMESFKMCSSFEEIRSGLC
jgi:uncharacterized protein (TIGR00730 family)